MGNRADQHYRLEGIHVGRSAGPKPNYTNILNYLFWKYGAIKKTENKA